MAKQQRQATPRNPRPRPAALIAMEQIVRIDAKVSAIRLTLTEGIVLELAYDAGGTRLEAAGRRVVAAGGDLGVVRRETLHPLNGCGWPECADRVAQTHGI